MWASRFLARSPAAVGLIIRFFFIGSRLCSTLLSGPTSRWAPLARSSPTVSALVTRPLCRGAPTLSIARLARRFAQRLNGRFNLPVALADETLSSATAAQRRNEAGLRSAELDASAAAEILMTWLELQRKKTGETS